MANVPFLGGYFVLRAPAQTAARLVMARALGAVGCLYFLSLSTPVPELLDALRRARVPEVVGDLAVLIYRYIFILFATFRSMRDAAASRLGVLRLSAEIGGGGETSRALVERCRDGLLGCLAELGLLAAAAPRQPAPSLHDLDAVSYTHLHGDGDAQHRLEPVRERQAAGEPDHHLGFPVIARDGGEHRDEDRHRQDGRQRRDGGQRGQHEHDVRPDVAARRFTEQAHQQHAEPYDEQRGKDNASVTGDLADDRAFE